MHKLIGRNVREMRQSKMMTQEKLGEMAGINPKYLGEIERGEKSPTAYIIYKLASALCVPICKIVSDDHCPHLTLQRRANDEE
jgi:transcriptional regulator with XRE-family HTH domain